MTYKKYLSAGRLKQKKISSLTAADLKKKADYEKRINHSSKPLSPFPDFTTIVESKIKFTQPLLPVFDFTTKN